jgi:hypothetical protein
MEELQPILEMLIPIFGIVFGTLLVGYAFGKIVGLIKAWINRGNSSYDDEKIDRIAKAFIQHKKDTDRRLQNIEAIVTEDRPASLSSSKRPLSKSESHRSIEIEADEVDKEQEEQKSGSGNLNNMLDKKRTK